ncbi:MAG: hypothetical protein Q9222_000164 [Ikaeria aurantiellina]
MPGQTFPYHMTPNSPLGLVFAHYDYASTFDNDIIERTFMEAAHQIDQELADDPILANQTLDLEWFYQHPDPDEPENHYWLSIQPNIPAMAYRDIPLITAVLATWATQWRTVETDFQIWAQPGT